MLITLSGLALAMTTTTVFLAWISPQSYTPTVSLDLQDLMEQHASLTSPAESSARQHWTGVQVVVESSISPASGTLLMAEAAGSDDWHFRIDRDGRTRASERWRRQIPTLHGGSAIRVTMVRQNDVEPFSAAQWLSLRALLTQLARRCPVDEMGIPVRLPEGLFQAYGLDESEAVYLPPLAVASVGRDLP